MPGGRIGAVLDRLIVVCERAIHVASVIADFASICIRLGEAVIEFDGAVEIGHRFIRLSPRLEEDAATVISHAVMWIELDGSVQFGRRLLDVAFEVVRKTTITPCVGQLRIDFDGLVEFRDRTVKFSSAPKDKAAFEMILGGARRLRLSRAGLERQRDCYHNDSLAEHKFSPFES